MNGDRGPFSPFSQAHKVHFPKFKVKQKEYRQNQKYIYI